MFGYKRLVVLAAAAAALVLALAAPARAGNLSDMTVDGLSFQYTPTPGSEFFTAFSTGAANSPLLSWTKLNGNSGASSPLLGDLFMTWDNFSSTGTLTVNNAGGVLSGSVTDFFWNGAQAFTAHVTLGTTFLDFAPGSFLEVAMTATAYSFDNTGKFLGVGQAVVNSTVPEPATLGLLGLGSAIVAVRRRRSR